MKNVRAALIADSHFCEDSRFDECVELHHRALDQMDAAGCDVVLHAGDVFDRKSTPRERNAVSEWLRRAAHRRPVVLVRGNHDALGDLAIFAHLRTPHPVHVAESPCVVDLGLRVACLPWPRKAELLAGADQTAPMDIAGAAREALRDALRALGAGVHGEPHEHPSVLLAHAMVTGSVTSTGQPLVGCDLEVDLSDLSLARCDAVALGHIHARQGWPLRRDEQVVPVVYPGSPRRTAFGELEPKGWTQLDFALRPGVGWNVETTFHDLNATKMLLAEARWTEEGLQAARVELADIADAEVRLRYTVAPDQRAAARPIVADLAAGWRASGARLVKVEEVVDAGARARDAARDVGAAQGLGDKLLALWRARGEQLTDDRRDALLTKAREIEGQ